MSENLGLNTSGLNQSMYNESIEEASL
jgi:hypothetical protein